MNRIVIAVGVFVVLGAGATLFIRLPQSATPSAKTQARAENILDAVRDVLRKDVSFETCRGAVQQLNSHLAQHPEQKPPVLTDVERQLLTSRLGLDPDEMAEVESPSFTLLDAHHLDLCLLLEDAARSLTVDDWPALKRATAALAWVTRQVRLYERAGDLVPVQFVLRRSWGTAVERALVFLALLDQLGLEGCLLAVPVEGQGGPGLRYWIPGVLSDGQIYLFDTRMGLPLLGPGGQGIATLTQVRSQPELLRALAVDDKLPYDVTADQAKQAEIHLVCSLSALAPRMQFLQAELSSSDRVSLSVKATTLLDNFQAVAKGPGLEGTEVRFASHPGDPNSPTRLLRRFLPPPEGGVEKTNVRDRFFLELIPWDAMPRQIQSLPGEPGQRLRQFFAEPFVNFAFGPRAPRDLMLHGHFDEAVTRLVAMRDELRRGKAMLQAETSLEQKVNQWCGRAVETYANLIRAEREAGAGGRSAALVTAQARVDELWKQSKEMVLLVRAATAEPFGAEATYLLALCKHEQAERSQARLERTRQAGRELSATETKTAQDGWRSAGNWWDTFLEKHPTAPSAASARFQKARVLEAQGLQEAAGDVLQDLTGQLTPLEKTGRLYWAKQLKAR